MVKTRSKQSILMFFSIVFASMSFADATLTLAQNSDQSTHNTGRKPCDIRGSSNVFVNGQPQLRLSDVAGCPGIHYEIIENVFINGEPAIRVLPNKNCVASGSENVLVDGKPVTRQGDVSCIQE